MQTDQVRRMRAMMSVSSRYIVSISTCCVTLSGPWGYGKLYNYAMKTLVNGICRHCTLSCRCFPTIRISMPGVVRNPFDRLISEYFYLVQFFRHEKVEEKTASELDEWLRSTVGRTKINATKGDIAHNLSESCLNVLNRRCELYSDCLH